MLRLILVFIFVTQTVFLPSAQAATTHYVGNLFEETDGQETNHIYLGNQKIASIVNGAVRYIHADHLGGANVVTDDQGAAREIFEYAPFGESTVSQNLWPSGTEETSHKFTGKEEDETGLYYYGARYYNPELGRFLTADSMVAYPEDPQSFNRYSYVHNNPINLVDPTGHWAWFIPMIIGAIKGAIIGAAIGTGLAAATGGEMGKGAMLGAIGGTFLGGTTGIMGHFVTQGVTYSTSMQILAYAEAGAYAGAVSAAILDQDPLKGAGLGALSGAAFGGIGKLGGSGWQWDLARIPLAGAAGGGISKLAGGDFLDGFIFAGSIASADFMYRAILNTKPESRGQGASIKPAGGPGGPKLDDNGNPLKGLDGKARVLQVASRASNVGTRSQTGYSNPWAKFRNELTGETGVVMSFLGTRVPGLQGLSRAHDIMGNFIETSYGPLIWGAANIPTMPPIYGLNFVGSAINESPVFMGLYEAYKNE